MQRTASRHKRILLLTIIAGVTLLAGWYATRQVPLTRIVAQENALRQWIAEVPVRAFALGLLIYTVASLIPGTSGKSVVYGWLYGFTQAVVIVLVGLTAAAMVTFWLSRGLLRPIVESRLGLLVRRLNTMISKDPAVCMLTLQFANVPYTLINYLAGASRLHAWTFCWTTLVGLLPGTLVFVYVGTTLPTLRQLATEGVLSLVDPQLMGALLLLAVVPLSVRWCVRRWNPSVPEAGVNDRGNDASPLTEQGRP